MAQAQVTGAEPYPIGWRRRWQLRRQGRLDGRHRAPDPLLLAEPVATGMRQLLLSELAEAWAATHAAFTEQSAGQVRRIRELRAEHARLRAQLAGMEGELARIEAQRPDPAQPVERRLGERHQPEALVRARRTREFDRRASEPRSRDAQARAALPEVAREHARLLAQVGDLHQQAVDQARRLRASFLRDQAVYHQALLRRHPEGDLLRELLDTGEPDLPAWATRPPELPELSREVE